MLATIETVDNPVGRAKWLPRCPEAADGAYPERQWLLVALRPTDAVAGLTGSFAKACQAVAQLHRRLPLPAAPTALQSA